MSKKPSGQKGCPLVDFDELIEWLETSGYEVTETRGQHYRVLTDGGIVVLPKSTSDWRATKNAVSLLRRHGVPL